MRKLKCQPQILLSIYYALFHSHLSYGLCIWGHAEEKYTEKIELAQKKAIRIISNADYLAHTKPLFKNLKILSVQQLFTHQYACLMWDFRHNNLPECFDSYFKNVNYIHDHYTRSAANNKLSVCGFNTIHGRTQFKYFGAKIHNSINELDCFNENRSKTFLKKKIKQLMINKDLH